jgi:NTE family protein
MPIRPTAKRKNRGLVLSGGGARAAYQAGVLKAISDLLLESGFEGQPFSVYTGESAGAINVSLLASHADNFQRGASELWDCWNDLEMDDILATSPVALLANATRWAAELSMGGLLNRKSPVYLLDNGPLKKYLKPKIEFGRIRDLLHENKLRGLGISVTNYATGSAISFFESSVKTGPWSRSHRLGLPTELKLEHVMASTAIPILFPPVRIGQSYYGDGSVRLKAPLSPAIHLGAESILAIGLRYYRTAQQTLEINESWKMKAISIADVAGVLLNAGFLDNLDGDLERLERINNTLRLIPKEKHKDLPNELRPITTLAMRPSEDLGQLAADNIDNFGILLKFLLRGLGSTKSSGADLVSYLAFDKAYTRKLLKLGYQDGLAQKKALLEFFGD